MGRNEELNKKIRDERREQILNAALKIFATRGLGSTKVSDIASAAKISHGLVYQYFSSKDEIFETLVQEAMDSTEAAAEMCKKIPGSPSERIKYFLTMFINSLEEQMNNGEYPYYFLIMIQAQSFEMVSDKVKEIVYGKPFSLGTFFYEAIVEGQNLGEISKDDPMKLTSLLLKLTLGIALSINPNEEPMPMPDVDTIMKMLKP